jgi:predicted dehydrogenase/threonine dehydrogenase-like Zn-dependent dehydrogenase
MKQVFLQKGRAKIQDVAMPLCGETSMLVEVHYSFISSGTEGALLKASGNSLVGRYMSNMKHHSQKVQQSLKENGLSGTYSLIKEKSSQLFDCGYSCSGRVVAIGAHVTSFKIGDFVACAGAGIAKHAQFISVPINLAVKLRSQDDLKAASITTIGAIALQGLRRGDVRLGETVCVVGLGLLGQLTVQLARNAGCVVIGVDTRADRLELARSCGADAVYNAHDEYAKDIAFKTAHHGVDATIITAASQSGELIDKAMEITRRKGKVVLVGDVKLDFSREKFYEKEIDFLISTSYGPGRYDASYELNGVDYPYAYVRWSENRNMQCFASLLESGKINTERLISQCYDLENASAAFDDLSKGAHLGIVLKYPESTLDVAVQKDGRVVGAYKAPQTPKLSCGFIGVGGFAKVKLLPILGAHKNVEIDYLVDPSSTSALNIKNHYAGRMQLASFEDVVASDVHAVIIATPHAYHADQALQLLKAGKAVFVEKPAAINEQQWDELKAHYTSDMLYCVDFNRSFAPFIMDIQEQLATRTSPALIHYRMNAGYIPLQHWTQQREHGGRIIGEACHIFDLFCFLIGSKPVHISLESLRSRKENVLSSDNCAINIRFADGSVCSLVYTALGNSSLSKERLEAFFDGKSIVMDDYISLDGHGIARGFSKKLRSADKGHAALLGQFIEAARKGAASPVPFERIDYTTRLSFMADALARLGGGAMDVDENNSIKDCVSTYDVKHDKKPAVQI